jgi:hypothetical protein
MRAFNFSLIAVLSCIAMIAATPIGNSAPAEAIARRQTYVPYQLLLARGGSDMIEKSYSSITCDAVPELCALCKDNPLLGVCSVLCGVLPLPICG